MDEGLKRLCDHVASLESEVLRTFPREAQRLRFVTHGARGADRRARRLGIIALVLGCAGAGAAALVLAAVRPRAMTFDVAGTRGRDGQWITTAADNPIGVSFSDGTMLALSPHAMMRVSDCSATGAHVVLERGRLVAAVVHRDAATRWRVDAGPFEVQVVGTRFDVRWDPARRRFDLMLQDGEVRVTGPQIRGTRLVGAGEQLEVDLGRASEPSSPAATRAALVAPTAPPPSDAAPPGGGARRYPSGADHPGARPVARPRPTPPSAWRGLAIAGRFDEAWASLAGGGLDEILADAGASDLSLVADVARFSGHTDQAAVALSTLRARFPLALQAADAPFLLGRLAADQRHDPADAAAWLTRYLREQPSGAFAEEAAGRLIECQRARGDDAAARDAARRYLADHPAGAYAPLARRVLDSP
jgi:hypothetical protein